MKKIFLGLAIHNHQPVGNFPWVFEQACEQAYLPFLEALERHPALRLSLHYSGPLLDWLKDNRPDFLGRLGGLVKRGQVELMGGGYYEPILPIIPEADRQGQIALMKTTLEKEFGVEPSGLWLAERVWETSLPQSLAQAGAEWTVVDDNHFQMVGLGEDKLLGYYLTEEQGNRLKVFPSLTRLRYLIPWKSVAEVMDFLKEAASEEGSRIAVMGDDGEKFGTWPGTHRHCWQEGWMERFFSALEENSSWVTTVPLGEYAGRFPPQGLVYLPNASYPEMLEWALPAERSREYSGLVEEMKQGNRADVLRYLRGGFWRHFLVKYPEINHLHKKMLRVSLEAHQARAIWAGEEVLEELWKAQCNCPYWHGVFGGVYLADIRADAHRHLIRAEKLSGQALRQKLVWLEAEEVDFDADGRPEILLEGSAAGFYLAPAQGGALFSWELRQHEYNLLSTLARRPEAYHQRLQQSLGEEKEGVRTIHDSIRIKDKDLPAQIPYDRYPRYSLLDHFLPLDMTMGEFGGGAYRELAPLAGSPYQYSFPREKQGQRLALSREAPPLRVVKTLLLQPGEESIGVTYEITNIGAEPVSGLFTSEWNLNLLAGGGNEAAFCQAEGHPGLHPGAAAELTDVSALTLGNRQLGLTLRLDLSPAARLWLFPVETVSNSEEGLERTYQATCLALLYPLQLTPGESFKFELAWTVE